MRYVSESLGIFGIGMEGEKGRHGMAPSADSLCIVTKSAGNNCRIIHDRRSGLHVMVRTELLETVDWILLYLSNSLWDRW